MSNIFHAFLQSLSLNADALGMSLATALATALVFGLKAIFSFARGVAQKTPTIVDDKIVDETETAFKEKSRDL